MQKMKGMRKIFLLGGYDLEMLEIKNILESIEDVKIFDQELTWDNASLNQYKDILARYENNPEYKIYGIELTESNYPTLPENYFKIDHHNDFNNKPSSLEQIASLFDTNLSRYLQLVAANDKAYIPGMLNLGATSEEIAEIRRKDREAQGVTEHDEELAEKAIHEKEIYGDLIIVKSETSRFSPICDRLFPYKQLLIYTEQELVFYGEKKSYLVELFESEIQKGKMFHGGGDNGYIGTVRDCFSKEEIEKKMNEIKIKILKS